MHIFVLHTRVDNGGLMSPSSCKLSVVHADLKTYLYACTVERKIPGQRFCGLLDSHTHLIHILDTHTRHTH